LNYAGTDTQERVLLQLDNRFWQFSLKVYAAPGVAAECLALQRALSIDVNVLLFCAWAGAVRRVSLDPISIVSIQDAVGSWHDTAVRPLRAARENIKTLPEMAHDDVQALRKQVAASELRAEQIEQALLFDWAQALPVRESDGPPHDLVRSNVEAFLKRHRGDQRPAGDLSCAGLIQAALRAAGQPENH
jgi:uncharacterized protein (TIGR02444 family)